LRSLRGECGEEHGRRYRARTKIVVGNHNDRRRALESVTTLQPECNCESYCDRKIASPKVPSPGHGASPRAWMWLGSGFVWLQFADFKESDDYLHLLGAIVMILCAALAGEIYALSGL
jgi:hypothetical protein